ncbi:MAG: V-type ATP synthase subunit E [Vicinamibacterales bacterium]
MALADLIARLEQDAANRVEAIRRQAGDEVRAIEAAAEQALSDHRAAHVGRRHAGRQAAFRRQLAEARRSARARELEARHALLARVMDRARSLLSDAAGTPAYQHALPAHLDEALSYVEGVACRVRCPSSCARALAAAAARHRGVSLEVDESIGPGFIVEALDGSVSIDNTLPARLSRVEGRLAVELLNEVRDVVA